MTESTRLPPGWASVPLRDLGKWTGGGTPSKTVSAYWTGGSIPWVSPKDMKVPVIFDSLDHITDDAVAASAAKLIPPGSVLVVTRSGILAHTLPVARTAVAVTVNQDIKALTPAPPINPDFVAWGVRAFGMPILHACSKDGTTVASVDTELLQDFPLPVAPKAEQPRIVSALESYLTRLDDAVTTLERVQRNLTRHRASVLKAAVEGRLVPTDAKLARAEGRSYEPASVLLTRILAERRRRWEEAELAKMKAKGKAPKDDKWKTKYVEPAAPDTSALPELPEGWCWASVDQLGDVSGGLTQNAKRNALPFQLPYLRVANVYANELRLDEVRTIGVSELEVDRVLLAPGDLLVVEGNGSIEQIGRVALWTGSIAPCLHQNHLIKVRFAPVSLATWSLCWLLAPAGRIAIESAASSTSGLHTLSLSKVQRLPIPLAPLLEQARITAEVERLRTVALAAEGEVSLSIQRSSRLRQSILKWAFNGRLVDQDPTDEPASALLERIRTEREATPDTQARRTRRKNARAGKK